MTADLTSRLRWYPPLTGARLRVLGGAGTVVIRIPPLPVCRRRGRRSLWKVDYVSIWGSRSLSSNSGVDVLSIERLLLFWFVGGQGDVDAFSGMLFMFWFVGEQEDVNVISGMLYRWYYYDCVRVLLGLFLSTVKLMIAKEQCRGFSLVI